jgi:inosine-uridine nucleoside N-ribohydrolase
MALPIAKARLKIGMFDQTTAVVPADKFVSFRVPLKGGPTELQTWFRDEAGKELCGAYYVYVRRLLTTPSAKIILDTDMSGDADDAGALALLHALADRGECELLATVTNRKDKTGASAAAVDAINTYYGRPEIPIGTDKQGPTALQRTSLYAPALRDGFPNDIGPDDRAPDALDVYRRVLAVQPDGSVTICSVGAFSNLAELWRRAPELVRAKVQRLVVMAGEFPKRTVPETNIRTHAEAARVVAAEWPVEIVWHGYEVGSVLITGEKLKQTPRSNPVRRAYELRKYQNRPSIEGGQPSYDQAAALFAVRGAEPEFWELGPRGRAWVEAEGVTTWQAEATGKHTYARIKGDPAALAHTIESLMIQPPQPVKNP